MTGLSSIQLAQVVIETQAQQPAVDISLSRICSQMGFVIHNDVHNVSGPRLHHLSKYAYNFIVYTGCGNQMKDIFWKTKYVLVSTFNSFWDFHGGQVLVTQPPLLLTVLFVYVHCSFLGEECLRFCFYMGPRTVRPLYSLDLSYILKLWE